MAGTYSLGISLCEKRNDQSYIGGEIIGSVKSEVEVPPIDGGQSDEPLDIGTLELEIREQLKIGDLAPLFEAETLDGKSLKLADYRGKVVLLVIWGNRSMQGVSRELQQQKAVYDTYSGNERFVMINLAANRDFETTKKLIKDKELKWTHCFLDPVAMSTLYKEYKIQQFPYAFLIGPDGKIIAKNLTISQLMPALNKALGM